jgi:peptide/nickel transport system ATP-binding protein
MMARALLVEPRLLIADEPTSMLDASLRATVLNLLLDLRAERNMAVLFITHDIGQAAYLSDRLLVMFGGEIIEQGTPDQVLFAPTHPYTRRLMADVPRLRHDSSLPFTPESRPARARSGVGGPPAGVASVPVEDYPRGSGRPAFGA